MGLFAFIGACIGAACSAIGSVFSCVCSAASAIAGTLGPLVKPILDIAIKVGKVVFDGIIKIVSDVAKALGLVPEQTEPEELGERARQHPEIKPEDYDSTKAYVQALREAPLDEEKFNEAKMDEKQLLLDKAAGLGIEKKLLEEKFKAEIPLDFFAAAVTGKMSTKDVCGMLDALQGADVRDFSVFSDYLAGANLAPRAAGKLREAVSVYEGSGGTPLDVIEENIANFEAPPESAAPVVEAAQSAAAVKEV